MTEPTAYALSIKQPWAGLIVAGRKAIEVRRWPAFLRGRIAIHAARIPDERPEAWRHVDEEARPLTQLSGGVIGSVELTGCTAYPSLELFAVDQLLHLNDLSWYQPNMFGFLLTRPRVETFQAFKGNVRFFTVPGAWVSEG